MKAKQIIKQSAKSKTIKVTTGITGLAAFLTACGVTIPIWPAIGIYFVGNIVLRFMTKKPLSEK